MGADTHGVSLRVLGVAIAASAMLIVPASAIDAAPEQPTAAETAPIPGIGIAMPAVYDPVASYEAQATCDPNPKPGTRALADLIKRTYGRREVIGISRGCRIGGTSEHKEGRALDWMTSVTSKRGFANARAFLKWLLGPDAAGVPYGNATRLGVMYIGWNNRYWAAYAKDRGWAELKGCLTRGGDATTCHRNHIHISLSWDGASGRTSLWDGTVLTGYCPSPWAEAPLAATGRAADAVAVTPFTALNTRLGSGISTGGYSGVGGFADSGDWRRGLRDVVDPSASASPAPVAPVDPNAPPTPDPNATAAPTATPTPTPTPTATPDPSVVPTPDPNAVPAPVVPLAPIIATGPCRLHEGGWHREHPGLLTRVTGQGGVPETGVAAVAVTVTVLGSTAPASITAWAPGQTSPTLVKVRLNGRGRGSAVIPVAADGTIGFSTTAGATDLQVQVTGFFPVGDQPNTVAPY